MLRWLIAFFTVFSLFGGEPVGSEPKLASDAQAIVDQFLKSKEIIRSDADTKIKKELDRLSEAMNQLVIQRINDGKIQESNTMKSVLKTLLEENTDLFGRAISTERDIKTESVAAITKVDEKMGVGETDIEIVFGSSSPIVGRIMNDQIFAFGTVFPLKRDNGAGSATLRPVDPYQYQPSCRPIPVGEPYIVVPLVVSQRKFTFPKWQVTQFSRIPKKERDELDEQQKAFAQAIENAVNKYLAANTAVDAYNTEFKTIDSSQEKCRASIRKLEDEQIRGHSDRNRTIIEGYVKELRKIQDKRIALEKVSRDNLIKDRQDTFNAVQVLMGQIIASKPSLSTENEAFRSGAKKP